MNCPRIRQKILPRTRISEKEFQRQHISFHSITRPARHHQIPRRVRSAFGEWIDMIDRGEIQIEWRAAIDAAAAAVAHHGAFHGALVLPPEDLADLSLEAARRAWEWNAVSAML
jgi:hypothetical protein